MQNDILSQQSQDYVQTSAYIHLLTTERIFLILLLSVKVPSSLLIWKLCKLWKVKVIM